MLSKDNIDSYLEKLSEKLLKKYGEKSRTEVYVVGGAAIALSHGFRKSTHDLDVYSERCLTLQDMASEIAEEEGLEPGWLCHNVMVTPSFTTRITEFSSLYKVFNDVLYIYVADPLTLICMKSVSCRPESHDLMDIKGIVETHPEIKFSSIVERFNTLYGDWSNMAVDAQMFLTSKYEAMPPDMVDIIWDMLPPEMVQGREFEKYQICESYYKSL